MTAVTPGLSAQCPLLAARHPGGRFASSLTMAVGGLYTQRGMALLTLNNVGLRRGGRWVLWDVCLEVEPGEIVAVFGRSGSGKTALARVMAGLEQPTGGSVSPGDISAGASHRLVSLASERPAYAPELTVYENLDAFAALWGTPRGKRAKKITSLLELLGLADRRGALTAGLSSGALRRLEIARALTADCPLIVIDSLLDGLDQDVFERLWEHLLALRRSGDGSVLALTASAKVAETAGRTAVLHRGRVVFDGSPDDLRRLAGEDVVVLGGIEDPSARDRIRDRFSLVIREEDGFLSFRTAGGERIATDLLAEFGSEVSCVYLKRPTLDDALDALAGGMPEVTAAAARKDAQ